MSNNPTSIPASYSTIKSMVDAKQYQSPYQILAESIQYIIIKNNLHSFTAVEMKNRLFEVFGFIVPEAVVRTTTRGLKFINTENGIHHVNSPELEENASFGNCPVHPQINIKFQKVNWAVMSNNKP